MIISFGDSPLLRVPERERQKRERERGQSKIVFYYNS